MADRRRQGGSHLGPEDLRLGMHRNITRRDFLQGAVLAIATPAFRASQSPPIPPSGFQGQNPSSAARGHRVRDDVYATLPQDVTDAGESYDLVVVAAWGMAAKHIVPELSESQREALEGYHYGSALYINVLLHHWRPIADIGAFEMYTPGGYATWMHVLDPLTVGTYHPTYHPDHPTVLSIFRYLTKPGHPPAEQMKLNRYELESKPFEAIEREVRRELDRLLGPWGFDPAEDILAITVNRWHHGYIIFPEPSLDAPVYARGRKRAGRISFAGADAGRTAWTQAAFRQAHRAAHEQLALA